MRNGGVRAWDDPQRDDRRPPHLDIRTAPRVTVRAAATRSCENEQPDGGGGEAVQGPSRSTTGGHRPLEAPGVCPSAFAQSWLEHISLVVTMRMKIGVARDPPG
jgi:hypothetical protein